MGLRLSHPFSQIVGSALVSLGLILCPRVTAATALTCVGDCDGSGEVRINEVILAVNIGLALTEAERCVAADRNGDGTVRIEEVIAAVNNGLSGCVIFLPTPTLTATRPTRPPITPTPTPSPEGPRPRELGPARRYSTNGIRTAKVAIGDLDGDGRNDVAIAEASGFGPRVLLYRQNADGALEGPSILVTSIGLRGVAIGDVNEDGLSDLLVSGLSLTASQGYLGRLVVYVQSFGSGSLAPPVEYTVSSTNVGDLVVADLDSDGRDDVAVVAEWTLDPERGTLSLFYQRADGTLAAEEIYDEVPTMPTGEIHAADVNGDGYNDILLQTGLLSFAVIPQRTDGRLGTAPITYMVETSYYPSFRAFDVGDLTGDGRNDVAVVDPGNDGRLNVFVQRSNGALERTVGAILPEPPFGIEIADIDGDGLDDLLGDQTFVGLPPMGAVEVFHQTREHTLGEPVRTFFETQSGGGSAEHRSLAVGDVTGDGWPDAVMAWADEGVWVLPSVPR